VKARPSLSHQLLKRRHAAAYVLRVPSDRDDSTAFAIRFATAGGISGSTAVATSPVVPSDAIAAGVEAGRKSTSSA